MAFSWLFLIRLVIFFRTFLSFRIFVAFTFFNTQLGKPLTSDLSSISSSSDTCLHWEMAPMSRESEHVGDLATPACSLPSSFPAFSSPGRTSGPVSTAQWCFPEFLWDHPKRSWSRCQGTTGKRCFPSRGQLESHCGLTSQTWQGALSAWGTGEKISQEKRETFDLAEGERGSRSGSVGASEFYLFALGVVTLIKLREEFPAEVRWQVWISVIMTGQRTEPEEVQKWNWCVMNNEMHKPCSLKGHIYKYLIISTIFLLLLVILIFVPFFSLLFRPFVMRQ